MSLIESIKTAQTKISFLSEEIGKHNIEKMREFYQRPELTGNEYLIMLVDQISLRGRRSCRSEYNGCVCLSSGWFGHRSSRKS